MSAQPLIVERTYNASPARVWEAITNRDKMKQWYFDLADFQPSVGFEFTFEGGSETQTYVHFCRVVEVVPGQKIAYTWKYKDYPGESKVTWELFPEGSGTRLRLTHEGLETFPQDMPDFARKSFTEGWTDILGISLVQYLQE